MIRKPTRRLVTLLTMQAAAVAAITCTDSSVSPAPARSPQSATLRFAPVFSAQANQAVAIYHAANLDITRVRIVIVRPLADTLKDTTVTTVPGAPDFTVDLEIPAVPGEQLQAGLQYMAGTTVLFAGQGPVVARAVTDKSSGTPATIAVVPVGPGATATSVTVSPASGSFPASTPVTLTARALGTGGEIGGALFSWSSDNAAVASVNASTGVVQPTAAGGTVHVRATTLNGVFGEATLTFYGPPGKIVTVSGSGQTGEVGSTLPQPIVVQVQTTSGVPVPGQTVLFGTSNGAVVSPASVTSTTTGQAQTSVTLGTTPGSYSVVATVAGFTTTATVTAVAGAPAAITAVSGSGQTDTVGHALKNPFVVRVTDKYGNPTKGATVTVTRTSGTGAASGATVVTGDDGTASIGYTLGTTVGGESVTASLAGVTGAAGSASFSATAIAGSPAGVTVVSGNGQFGIAGTTSNSALIVRVTDAGGNPIAGAPVSWTVRSGAATLQNVQGTTGADGRASATVVFGAAVGPVVIAATSGTQTVVFNLAVVTGSAAQLALVSGGGQTAAAGTALPQPIVVKVADSQGNPVATETVTFAVASGGGSLSATSVVTNGQGQASTTWTLGSAAGTQTITATRAGLAGSPLTISATATGSGPSFPPGTRLIYVQQPSTTAAGAVITPAVTVRVVDIEGSPVTNFAGNITIALGTNPSQATLGGTLTSAAVAGLATFNNLTVSAPGSGYTLIASTTGLADKTSLAFNVTSASNVRTWTGNVSTDWNVAGNWDLGVPGPSNDVVIPSSRPNQPALTSQVTIASLTVNSGATLTSGPYNITATGTAVTAAGPIVGTGQLVLTGTTTLSGSVPTVYVSGGTVTFAGTTSITGGLSVVFAATATVNAGAVLNTTQAIQIADSRFATAGTVNDGDLFLVTGTGVFSQTAGTLTVSGNTSFGGASTTGQITGGTLRLLGNFTQQGTATSFVASGTHRTTFANSADVEISFQNVGSSHFQDLELANTGNVYTVGLTAAGQLISPAGATPLSGNGTPITVSGLNVDGLTLTNVPLVSTGGTITKFDNVTFQGYSPSATALTINHPGASTPFTFTNDQFLVTPSSGKFVSATDTAPTDGNVLTINFVSSTPADGGFATTTSGGAVVTYGGSGGSAERWINPSGGSWSAGSNWSLGRPPMAADSVVIDLAGTYTVTLDTTYTGKYIGVGGSSGAQTLSLSNRTLTLSQALKTFANGTFAETNGMLLGAATVTNAGTLTLKNVTAAPAVVNQGTINVTSATLNGALTTTSGSNIVVQSDGSVGTAQLIVASDFTNNGTINLSSTVSGYSATLSDGGTITNGATGVINALPGTGGTRSISASVVNQGTINVNAPLSTSGSATVSNSGTINVTGGDLNVLLLSTGTLTNSGTLNVQPGRTASVTSGAFTETSSGVITGGGGLSLSGVTAAINTGFTLGSVSFDAGTVSFVSVINTGTTTLTATGGTTLNGSGGIVIPGGVTTTLALATINLDQGVSISGTLVVPQQLLLNTQPTTAPGSTIRIASNGSVGTAFLQVANGFTNNGTIELSSTVSGYTALLTVTNGTLTNGATGVLLTSVGTGGSRVIDAQIVNNGAITANQPLTIQRSSSAVDTNAGSLNANADVTISLTGGTSSFTTPSGGAIHTTVGHTVTISGGTFTTNNGSTLDGGGTLSLANSTAALGQSFSLGGLLLSGTTLALTPDITTAGLTVIASSSTINGPGTITNVGGQTLTLRSTTLNDALINQGTLQVTIGTINGTLTTGSSSVINVASDGSVGTAQLTVANGFTNNGAINLSSAVSGYTSGLTVTSGTLTNAGTIATLAGTGGPRFIDAQLVNNGTLTVSQPLTLQKAGGQSVNNGTINVTGGDLTVQESGTSPSFTASAGSALHVASGRTFTVTGGTVTFQSSAVADGAGTFALSNTDASFNSNFAPAALTVNGGSVTFASNITTANTVLTLANTTVNGSVSITNAAGVTLTLRSVTFSSTTSLINNGTVVATIATLNGPLTANAGGTIRIQSDGSVGSALLTVANSFTNNGAIALSSTVSGYSSTLAVSSGTLTNASGGVITAEAGTGGSRTLDAQLQNDGTVTVLQPLTLSHAGAQSVSDGTINVSGGDFTVQESGASPSFSLTGSGATHVSAGRTFTVSGGTFAEANTASIDGAGTVSLSNTAASLGTQFTPGNLTVNGGSVLLTANISTANTGLSLNNTTIAGSVTVTNAAGQTLALRSVTFNSGVSLNNSGTLAVTVATLSGPLTTTSTSTIRVQSDGTVGSAQLTVANSFTNNGTIELSSTVSGYSSTLTVTSGTLTNANGAVLQSLAGTGGTRTIAGNVTNQGTLNVVPGDAGLLTITGNLSMTSTSILNIELGGTGRGTTYDAITLGSGKNFTAGGTLNVSLINGYSPATTVSFTVVAADTTSSNFATINYPAPALEWSTTVASGIGVRVTHNQPGDEETEDRLRH